MSAALAAILALIQQVLPLISGATNAGSLIASIIKALETWLPIIISEIKDLYPIVKNIIEALKSKDIVLTDDQKSVLQKLDLQTDLAFEAATQGLDPDAI